MACRRERNVLACCLLAIHVMLIRGQCDLKYLNREYSKCASDHPSISGLLKDKEFVSGMDLLDVINGFCAATDAIHMCVEDHIAFASCFQPRKTHATLEAAYEESEWLCEGNEARSVVADSFMFLPIVNTKQEYNNCLMKASKRRSLCNIELLLSLSLEDVTDWAEKKRRMMQSMLCVYKGIENAAVCPLNPGLLTTVLMYTDTVVPPILGVNVSQTLLSMRRYLEQH